MRDWQELVRERMLELNLPPSAKEEVIAELAAHLEDCADRAEETNELANHELTQIRSRKLLRAIERTRCEEGKMNCRTKTVWLPSICILFAGGLMLLFLNRAAILQRLVWFCCAALLLCAAAEEANRLNHRTMSFWLPALQTLLGVIVSLMFFELFGMQPYIVWFGKAAMWFYWSWLATLPVFGAMGALLSRRGKGTASARLAAGLSPALIMLTVMLVILPWGLTIDGMDFFRLAAFGLGLLKWVVLPGVALLLGAAPFLREPNHVRAETN